jgi:DNA polymerase
MSIKDVNAEIKRCSRCRLSETRIHALCGEGNLSAKLMLIAQAPGENEDRSGTMFIGPSGKVLDELLKMNDIDRKNIYMTNLIKCMLPTLSR